MKSLGYARDTEFHNVPINNLHIDTSSAEIKYPTLIEWSNYLERLGKELCF